MKNTKLIIGIAVGVVAVVAIVLAIALSGESHTHEFGEWDVAEKPTCSEKGTKVRYCSCGEKQTEAIVTLDHSFGDWATVKEPTVTEEGLKERTCACGEKETQKIDKRPVTYSKDLKFILNDDDQSYTVTGIGTCTDTDVFIPNTYEGLPVTSIGDRAFRECTGFTSIVIPDSVTSIGDMAFERCTGLTSIVIPDSVTSIGRSAFSGCTGLTSITVDEDNTSYQSIDGNLYSKDGKTLIQYAIGKKNTSFTIPDSVTSIGYAAFGYCTGLTSIVIPDSVETIGEFAFAFCSNLSEITLGESLRAIGGDAFRGCTGLTSIVIPDSVETIGEHAFTDCSNLSVITLGESLRAIGVRAFDGCTGLTDVYYIGTEAEGAKISIYPGNSYLQNATIHYNYVPAN